MFIKKSICFIIACLAVISTSLAQEEQQEAFTNVRPVNGVGNEYKITSFAIDRDNNKYIGTSKGLLKVATNGNTEILYSGGSVHAVVWHVNEGLWIAIDSNKLYQPETRTEIALGESGTLITAMDMSGSQIWAGSNNGVFVVSTQKGEVFEHYTTENSKLESNIINDIYIDASRLKWIGTTSGVVRVDNKKWKVYEEDHNVSAMTGNSEGLWIAADNEMWLVDPFNRWTPTGVTEDLSEGPVRALAADKKGQIYVLSDILVQFDPYTDQHVILDNDYTPQAGADVAIMFDEADNLWLGSLEHGLMAVELESSEDIPLEAFLTIEHPQCFGQSNGSLTATATGGTPPYRFQWSDTTKSGRQISSLASGDYSLTVTDANGIQESTDARLTQPDRLSLSVQPNGEKSARAIGSGGTGGYEYTWSNNMSGGIVEDLTPAVYSITVTDNSGCAATADYVQPEPEIQLTNAKGVESIDANALKVLDAATLAVGQTLRVEELYFAADSTDVKPESNKVLDEVFSFLSNNDNIVIEIGGHTNGLPEHEYCDRLSTARAKSVADYLYSKGIPNNRIAYKGYGKRQPVATNSTVEGRRKNQRVEIKILEI